VRHWLSDDGATCTTTTDCCSGLPCIISAGASTGTCGTTQGCADYGQTCDATHPCCNNVTCGSNGTCGQIIL